MSRKTDVQSEFQRILERKIGASCTTVPSTPTANSFSSDDALSEVLLSYWSQHPPVRPSLMSHFRTRYKETKPSPHTPPAETQDTTTQDTTKKKVPRPLRTWTTEEKDAFYTFKVLGDRDLTQECTSAEIKRAYRRLALTHHPDRSSGSSQAFQKLHKAYEILVEWDARHLVNE